MPGYFSDRSALEMKHKNDNSMIISRTPYRVSFFGGGTDYPNWYREFGGKVLATTIDKYVYVSCRRLPPFFEHRLRLVYSKIEQCMSLADMQHPTAREVLRYLDIDGGLEIHYDGDLPARSGVGSSSAFTVGLINALTTYISRDITPRELALTSIEIEQEIVKECVGSQDQVSAAYGGFNIIEFCTDGEIQVRPAPINRDRISELEDCLMLFYTGFSRTASSIASSYVPDLVGQGRQLSRMYEMVEEAVKIVCDSSDLDDFGTLLGEMWLEKRSLSHLVTNDEIDTIYSQALKAGALGGKLIGAGGGGMLLLYVPPTFQHSVKQALKDLIHIPFRFDPLGSQIIYRG